VVGRAVFQKLEECIPFTLQSLYKAVAVIVGVTTGADPLKVGQLNFVYFLSKEAGDIV